MKTTKKLKRKNSVSEPIPTFKKRGEIPVDEYGVLFLPPILWGRVMGEVRKREESKIWKKLRKLFGGE